MTLDSMTLGSMHIWVSWLRDTSVQLVTAPATYLGRGAEWEGRVCAQQCRDRAN